MFFCTLGGRWTPDSFVVLNKVFVFPHLAKLKMLAMAPPARIIASNILSYNNYLQNVVLYGRIIININFLISTSFVMPIFFLPPGNFGIPTLCIHSLNNVKF